MAKVQSRFRRHARDRRQLVISIANTELTLLEFVRKTVGAGKITGKRVTSTRHSPSFTYCISNRQALCLLEYTARFLQSYKRARAALVLANYVRLTPRNGKYTRAMILERDAFEQALLALKAREAG